MRIELSRTTAKRVELASRRLGVGHKELAERAIAFYLTLEERRSLEMDRWDALSDEALAAFEKTL